MSNHPETNWIVVLNGTWTGSMGTQIAFPTDDQLQALKEVDPDEVDMEAYDLHALIQWAYEHAYFTTTPPVNDNWPTVGGRRILNTDSCRSPISLTDRRQGVRSNPQ